MNTRLDENFGSETGDEGGWAHVRQSRLDSGLGVQVKVLGTFRVGLF